MTSPAMNASSSPAPLDRSSWKRVRLGEICSIVMGQSPDSSGYNENGEGLPLIQGNADIENRVTIRRTFTRHITKRAYKGDLILTVRAPVGNVARAAFDCCLGRGVCALRDAPPYLYYLLEQMEPNWGRFSGGSTFDSINSDSLAATPILFPPLPVQRRIASSLSAVDGHLASLGELVSKYEAIKKSTVSLLLRPQPTWQTKPLGDLAFIKTGTRNTQDAVEDGKYPFFVRSPIVERINTFSFDGEAVLVAGDGVGAGKVFHYVNGKHDCHQRVYRLCNFSAEVCGRYVYHVLTSRFPVYMEQRNDKASVDSLRLPTFKEFPVQYPAIDEQRKIVHAIDTCDAMLSSLAAEREKLASLKRGLLRHFFG